MTPQERLDLEVRALKLENLQREKEQPGGEENPLEKDLFESDWGRIRSSFGNAEGTKGIFSRRGYKNVHQNKAGDVVAEENGKYYKDADSLLNHPVNWMESGVGKAAPIIGLGVGAGLAPKLAGLLAGRAGIALAPHMAPLAKLAGNLVGASFGAGAGEAAKIGTGKFLNSYQGDDKQVNEDISAQAAAAPLYEMGGKLFGHARVPNWAADRLKIPRNLRVDDLLEQLGKSLINPAIQGSAKIHSFLAGPAKEHYEEMIRHPDKVKGALTPENILNTAERASRELKFAEEVEMPRISEARAKFKENQEVFPTEEYRKYIDEVTKKNKLNHVGHGYYTQEEMGDLAHMRDEALTTPKVTGQQDVTSQLPLPFLDVHGNPTTKSVTETHPVTTNIPEQTGENLFGTVDMMRRNISKGSYDRSKILPKDLSGPYKHLSGMIKKDFYKRNPEFGAANERYHKFAKNLELLKEVQSDKKQEGFVRKLFGVDKEKRRKAARAVLPNSYKELRHIEAAQALNSPDRLRKLMENSPSGPAVIRVGVPSLLTIMGYFMSHHSPMVMGGTAAITGLTSLATTPTFQKNAAYIIGKVGIPAMEAMAKNPQLIPMLLSAGDQALLKGMLPNATRSAWSNMSSTKKEQ